MPSIHHVQLTSRLRALFFAAAMGTFVAFPGCERKEKILDIEAPGVDLEVDKTRDGFELRGDRKPPKKIDIEAPGIDLEIDRDRD